ncbi:MAG: hypothetical protein ACREQ4_12560 [Candidatus Binataceae bacterium]
MADFTLQAVIAASTEKFNAAMSQAASMASQSFERIRGAFAQGAEQSTASMTRMQETAETASHSMTEQFAGLTESVRHMAEGFAVFEGLNWARESISQSLEMAEKLRNMSVETGISTQHLQELRFAAGATGQDFERLTQSMAQLSIKALEVGGGGSSKLVGSALQTLGLKKSDLNDSYSLLLKVGDAINRLGTNSTAARGAVSELFGGRSGAELIPLITHLREFSEQAEKMGLVLNSQTLDALDQAQEKFNILGQVIEVDKERIAAALVPVLETTTSMLTQLAEKVNQLAQNGELQTFAVTAADKMIDFAEAVVTTTAKVESFAGTIKKLYQFGLDMSPAYWIVRGVDSAISGTHNLAAAVGLVAVQADKTSAAMRMLEQLRTQIHAAPTGGIDTGAGTGTGAAAGGIGGGAGAGKGHDNSKVFASQAAQIARWQQQQRAAQAAAIADAAKASADQVSIEQAGLNAELAAHVITNQEKLQGEMALAAKLKTIHESEFAQLASLYQGDSQKLQSVLAQKTAMETQYTVKTIQLSGQMAAAQQETAKRVLEAQQKAAEQSAKSWQNAFAQIGDYASKSFDILLSGSKNVGAQFERMGGQMLESVVKSTMMGALEGGKPGTLTGAVFGGGLAGAAAHMISPAAAGGPGAQGQSLLASSMRELTTGVMILRAPLELLQAVIVMLTSSNALLSSTTMMHGASVLASMGATILNTSATEINTIAANAGTIASYAVAIVEAAKSVFSSAGGFDVPSFADGGIATGHGKGTLSVLHPREMVLPAKLAGGVRDIISNGQTGGGHHIETHVHVNALDSKSFESRIHQHAKTISDAVTNHLFAQGGIYRHKKG